MKGSFGSDDEETAEAADVKKDVKPKSAQPRQQNRPGTPTPVPLITGAFLSCKVERSLAPGAGHVTSLCGLQNRVGKKVARPKHLSLETALVNKEDMTPAAVTPNTKIEEAAPQHATDWHWQITYPEAADLLLLLTVTRQTGNFSEKYTTPLK